ncbi:MAG TPA: hypothetical protein VN372_02055, partial [Methanospirillum sp.]|nr:hypothetical protein [Methanospirillum sp.]
YLERRIKKNYPWFSPFSIHHTEGIDDFFLGESLLLNFKLEDVYLSGILVWTYQAKKSGGVT